MALNRGRKLMVILGGIAIVIIAIIVIIVGSTNRTRIKMNDYITDSYNGIQGGGRISLSVDADRLYKDIAGDEKNTIVLEKYRTLANSVKAIPNQQDMLSNGDTVQVNVTYDNELAKKMKCNFDNTQYSVKVSGLGEGRVIDIFENVDVVVAGTSPEVYANVVNKWTDEYLGKLSFTLSKSNGISNGETIVVGCSATVEELEEHGISAVSMVKEFKVNRTNEYASDINQLDMSLLKTINNEAVETIRTETESLTFRMFYKATNDSSYLFQYNDEKVNSTEFTGAIFLSKKDDAGDLTHNYVYLMYKSNISNGTTTGDIFFAFEYSDAIITADGNFTITHTDEKSRYICGMDYNDIYGRVILSKENQYNIVQFEIK